MIGFLDLDYFAAICSFRLLKTDLTETVKNVKHSAV